MLQSQLSHSYSRTNQEPSYLDHNSSLFVSPFSYSKNLESIGTNEKFSQYKSPEIKTDDFTRRLNISPRKFATSRQLHTNASLLGSQLSDKFGSDRYEIRTKSELRYARLASPKSKSRQIDSSRQRNAGGYAGIGSRYETSANDEGSYSQEYVEKMRQRTQSDINEIESKYEMLSREYEDFKNHMRENITALHRQIEKEAEKHAAQIEKNKREISYDTEKKIKVFEYETQKLQDQVKQFESEVEAANERAEKAEREKTSLESAHKNAVNDLKIQMQKIEVDRERERNEFQNKLQMLSYEHDREKRKLKEVCDKKVSELSQEIKHVYEKTNHEMNSKEEQIGELEQKISTAQRKNETVRAEQSSELNELRENNKHLKGLLEESRVEILRLTAALDDKKSQVSYLQSKANVMKPERLSRPERDHPSYSQRSPASLNSSARNFNISYY